MFYRDIRLLKQATILEKKKANQFFENKCETIFFQQNFVFCF